MLVLTEEQQIALTSRQVMRRNFIWCDAKHPVTGESDPAGFWDDVGDVTIGDRIYHGSGSLFGLSTLSAKSDLSIPGITISLSGVSEEVVNLVRSSNLAQAPVEVSIGIYDVASHNLIGGIIRRFTGVIDNIDITTPAVGQKSTIVFTCESTSRALTIKSTNTRSASSMRQRSAADAFYDYTAAMPEAPIYFGRAAP